MTAQSNKKVSVLGLGIMGQAIAAHLQKDGLLAATWNRSSKPDAPCFQENILEAVSEADVILIVVIDGQAVSDVLDQILPVLNTNQIVIQCATVKPDENIACYQRCMERSIPFIEALMGGSEQAVLDRKLPLYIGGDKAVFESVDSILSCFSPKRLYVGDVGKASVAKLAMNLNLAMQLEALCESYAFAISNGLYDDQYFDVLRNNTGWNYLSEYKEPRLRNKNFAPQFALKNMLKDVRLALSTDNTSHGLRLLKETERIYAAGEKAGLGEEDMIALYKLIHQV